MRSVALFLALILSLGIISCKRSSPAPRVAIRLVNLHQAKAVENSPKLQPLPEKTEWRFDVKEQGLQGWESLAGIRDLSVRKGKLTGRSTTNLPVLHLERKKGLDNADVLHSIEVRMRASAGSNLSFSFSNSEKFDLNRTLDRVRAFPSLSDRSPLIAGDSFQTYILKPRFSYPSSDIKHIVFTPTDLQGAEFEVESIRLVFRKEYLERVPSGVSWQGLKGVYQETIVSRSPESVRMNVTFPKHAWLDVNLGTIEDHPVTFRVAVKSGSSQNLLMERTLTRPHRWEPLAVEIPEKFSEKRADLLFSLGADEPGRIGFWGAPVIRSHGALPATKSQDPAVQAVIVIWTDTLRRDHLNVYGYNRETAPCLAKMAQEGALLRHAVTQATWTKVASPTLVTSLYPASHGVRDFTDRLPSSAVTMAEVFQDAGYATINFSSNLFTGTFSNFHQGFEQVHEDGSLPNPDSSKTAREYMDRLLPWIDTHRDVPFFVFLHAYDAHDPYEPYAPYNTMWADANKKEEHERQLAEVRKIIRDPLMKVFGMPSRAEMVEAKIDPEAFVSYDRDWYDGSIRGLDAEIRRLLEHLRNRNLTDRTLIVFMGDHGEEFLEHGRMFHGQTVYGELTNVPLILKGPGISRGLTVDDTVETVDVMPTVLELAGLNTSAPMQGRSFASLLRRSATNGSAEAVSHKSKPAFSEKVVTKDAASPAPHDTESFAVVQDGWKLIHNTKASQGSPEYELYDQNKDPINRINVAEQNPEIVKRLAKTLEQWRKTSAAARLKPDSNAAKGLSQEELERLRSLGYIQ